MRVQEEEHPGIHSQGQQPSSYLSQLQTQGATVGRGVMPTSQSQKGWEVGSQLVELVLSCTHLCIHQGAA